MTVDGSRPPVRIGCGTIGAGACPESWAWSPDDTVLVGTVGDGSYVTADPDTGAVTPTTREGRGEPAYQRLAP